VRGVPDLADPAVDNAEDLNAADGDLVAVTSARLALIQDGNELTFGDHVKQSEFEVCHPDIDGPL
jgi:hypothetical protein